MRFYATIAATLLFALCCLGKYAPASTAAASPAPRYQYWVTGNPLPTITVGLDVNKVLTNWLNNKSAEGWELVCISYGPTYTFRKVVYK